MKHLLLLLTALVCFLTASARRDPRYHYEGLIVELTAFLIKEYSVLIAVNSIRLVRNTCA